MEDKPNKTTIIVKKIKKNRESPQGGSWKVAYADFTTAMMAFFLLLWLLSMLDPVKRSAIADYFTNFSLLQSGQTFKQQPSVISKENSTPGQNNAWVLSRSKHFEEHLKKIIAEKLKELEGHILIDTVEGGVRIQIIDLEGEPMFPLSSSEPTEKAKAILKVVAENIKDEPARIAVEGHTDAVPFKDGTAVTNWELSTARASSALRELEKNGVDPAKIARVVGYADTMPLIKEDTKDPRNRRISIILMFDKEQKQKTITQLQQYLKGVESVLE